MCRCGKVCKVYDRYGRSIRSNPPQHEEYVDTEQRKAQALQANKAPTFSVGPWNSEEGERDQRYYIETPFYSQGIFRRYSDLRISYESTFAYPLKSLKQLYPSWKFLQTRF